MTQPKQGSVYPCLTYEDPVAAIAWLCEAFGFTKRLVVPSEEVGVMHSELSLGGAVVMVSGPKPEVGRRSPKGPGGVTQTLSVWVEDPDEHYAQSIKSGAELVGEIATEEFGARGYAVRDLEGHSWYFSDYIPGAFWDQPE
ncbi:MAG: putative glyoxalase superfamily protein PhnB [Planctomycetota bacterium]|jgi:uncharacterized glyoxalase superfamily protein PhnB